jgi:hypothetical protein
MEYPSQGYSQAGCRESSAKLAPSESPRTATVSCPSPFNPCILPAYISVPVVQRIEQGFPKAKTAFLLEFADVVSSEQVTAFKRVEQLLRSSRVITNRHVSTCPGDTTGDTRQKIPPILQPAPYPIKVRAMSQNPSDPKDPPKPVPTTTDPAAANTKKATESSKQSQPTATGTPSSVKAGMVDIFLRILQFQQRNQNTFLALPKRGVAKKSNESPLPDLFNASPDKLFRSEDNVSEPLTNPLRMSVVFIVNSLSEHEASLSYGPHLQRDHDSPNCLSQSRKASPARTLFGENLTA